MSFPAKGILDGSERLALYDEIGGTVHVTTQAIADLAGVSNNGVFSAANSG